MIKVYRFFGNSKIIGLKRNSDNSTVIIGTRTGNVWKMSLKRCARSECTADKLGFQATSAVVTFSNETLPFVTGDSTSRAVYPWNCGIWFGWRAIKK